MEIINLATREKQDEILSHFPINITLPASAIISEKGVIPSGSSDMVTAIEVTGSGYIMHLFTSGEISAMRNAQIKITVDNKVIYHITFGSGYTANDIKFSGIFCSTLLHYGSNYTYIHGAATFNTTFNGSVGFPFIPSEPMPNGSSYALVFPTPFRFNNNFKLEIKRGGSLYFYGYYSLD